MKRPRHVRIWAKDGTPYLKLCCCRLKKETTEGHVASRASQYFPVVVEISGVILRLMTVWTTFIGRDAWIESEHGDIDELNSFKKLLWVSGKPEEEAFDIVVPCSTLCPESSSKNRVSEPCDDTRTVLERKTETELSNLVWSNPGRDVGLLEADSESSLPMTTDMTDDIWSDDDAVVLVEDVSKHHYELDRFSLPALLELCS